MKFERSLERVQCQKETIEGNRVCVYFKCPNCGKEHNNTESDHNWVKPGDKVTCDCGREFIVY